ncbi:MAG TPA: DUF1152 domain-containing protein [Thermoleophilaceae bacterium]|nr:DUF1152 domain-containing protein [Thermoleophilaceae bacterium]
MIDADALLAASRRPLVIGVGGGGDVVGALAVAESCRQLHAASPVVGGVTWERRPIDPRPGPRSAGEIEGARVLAGPVLAASPATRVRGDGTLFAESHMARFLGEDVVLVDPHPGVRAVAEGLSEAMEGLGCDLLVALDVGGDALAHGDEPGLGSPLCDALMLAAAARVSGVPVLGAVFGIGCDGELTPAETLERLGEVAEAGGLAGARGLTGPVVERLEGALAEVPTEASAQAVRAFRGAGGPTAIRGGRRSVELSAVAAGTFFFDVAAALRSSARLAAAVGEAGSLEQANTILNALGVHTELDLERGPPA